MQSTPTNNEQMTFHLYEQSLYKPCVFYQQKNQRKVWKIDWNTVLVLVLVHEPVGVMRKHQVIILIF